MTPNKITECNSKEYPAHLASSLREWKQLKRQEMRLLLNRKELDNLLCGCLYTPCYEEISQAIELLRQAKEKMRVDKWGR